jgi:hypothetical protein
MRIPRLAGFTNPHENEIILLQRIYTTAASKHKDSELLSNMKREIKLLKSEICIRREWREQPQIEVEV